MSLTPLRRVQTVQPHFQHLPINPHDQRIPVAYFDDLGRAALVRGRHRIRTTAKRQRRAKRGEEDKKTQACLTATNCQSPDEAVSDRR